MVAKIVMAFAFSFVTTAAFAQEAAALLRKSAQAMGADNLKTLRYAGSGTGGQFGQAYRPDRPWPKLNYSSYERLVDNLQRLKLDVQRILPLHGRIVPASDLYSAAGKQL